MDNDGLDDRMKIDAERINATSAMCSWCGEFPPGGCEFGIIDDNGVPQSFCNADCMAMYNLSHGLSPTGKLLPDDGLGGRAWG